MLIKWGSIIVKGSGKLGGHVFSSGKSGASVHTASKARNPQTVSQSAVRSRFTKFTQGWRNLSETQRDSWYDAESSFSRTNRFGDVVFLSGKNLYESLNTNRAIMGLGVIDLAPMPGEIPKNIVTRVEFNSSFTNLAIVGNFENSIDYVIVATKGLSQGVRNFKNEIRIIGIGRSSTNGQSIIVGSDQMASYRAEFGEPVAGTKIFVGTYSINTSGQRSPVSMLQADFV